MDGDQIRRVQGRPFRSHESTPAYHFIVPPARPRINGRINPRRAALPCLKGEHGPANHDQQAPHGQHEEGEPPKFPYHLFPLCLRASHIVGIRMPFVVTVTTLKGSHAFLNWATTLTAKGVPSLLRKYRNLEMWLIILILRMVTGTKIFQCRQVPEMGTEQVWRILHNLQDFDAEFNSSVK